MSSSHDTTPEPYPGAPAAPVVSDELSEADLDSVSGGVVTY